MRQRRAHAGSPPVRLCLVHDDKSSRGGAIFLSGGEPLVVSIGALRRESQRDRVEFSAVACARLGIDAVHVLVHGRATNSEPLAFETIVRLDTPVDVEYYKNGGILHTVLRKMAKA
jgi:hypothetical protein